MSMIGYPRCPDCGHHLPLRHDTISHRWDDVKCLIHVPTYDVCPCQIRKAPHRHGKEHEENQT
jgi:hypothetical protein